MSPVFCSLLSVLNEAEREFITMQMKISFISPTVKFPFLEIVLLNRV
jgi:hypothetical protein